MCRVSTGQSVKRGDVFRDAPNAQALKRTLTVLSLFEGSAMCREEGTALYPQIPLAQLLDPDRFERAGSSNEAAA